VTDRRRALLRAFKHRPFVLLWSGQSLSRLGDSVYLVALPWWVVGHHGSAGSLGLILLAGLIPTLAFTLIGGVAVDRFPRLPLLLLSDGVRGLILVVVTLLAATGSLAVWHLVVASFLFGTVDAIFFPAYRAAVRDLTPSELLTSANSLTRLGREATAIAGPLIAATLIAVGGTPLAFGLDAVSFFLSAAAILAIFPTRQVISSPPPPDGSPLAALREGFNAVIRSPWLWVTIAIAGISNVTMTGPLEVVLPFLVSRHFHLGVTAYGLLNALTAAGAVLAAVTLGLPTRLRHRGLLAYIGWLAAAAAVATLGVAPFVVAAAVMLVVGGGLATLELVWTNTLQELVPSHLLGRVSSIDALGSYALIPVGYLLAGGAADLIGPAMVFVLGGLASVMIIGVGLLQPSIRRLD
jgi:hypothetical protein